MGRELVREDVLVRSSVVANNAMNRERQLSGVNSYHRELGFHPLDWLRARMTDPGNDLAGPTWSTLGWLDLCCGRGRALLHAADELHRDGIQNRFHLVGVDLIDTFDVTPQATAVRLVAASVVTWQPPYPFDLITCVHGLHYVGDKLAVIARAAAALTESGLFVADLDISSIRQPDGNPMGRTLTTALREAGIDYDTGAIGSAARAGATSTCRSPTSAPTTTPARTTPTNQPCTPTTNPDSTPTPSWTSSRRGRPDPGPGPPRYGGIRDGLIRAAAVATPLADRARLPRRVRNSARRPMRGKSLHGPQSERS